MDRGYVKLWRKTLDIGILKSHEYYCFWSWCLLKASYKERTIFFNGVEVPLKPGEFIFGRRICAEALSISEQKVRTLLKKAIRNGHISTSQTTNRYSILSIVKWDTYQVAADEANQPEGKQSTSNQPTVNQQSTSNQPQTRSIEVKNGLEGLKKKEPKTLCDPPDHAFDPIPFFETFWKSYPRRNGKKIGKGDALKKYKVLVKDEAAASEIQQACNHYALNCGELPKDAHRWLSADRWKEWITPDIVEAPPKIKSQVFDAIEASLRMKGPQHEPGTSKAPIRRNPRQLPVPRRSDEDNGIREPDS
jgi:hypothetical protein